MTDRDDVIEAVHAVDGATVRNTDSGEDRIIDLSVGGDLRLVGPEGDIRRVMTPTELLDWLKRGEYYLPDGDGIQDDLRTIADAGTEP